MVARIVAVSDRPDLALAVARWRIAAFPGYYAGRSVGAVESSILAPPDGPEETFVLFDGDSPAGTAALVRSDLESRPDLTPWLAGVFVEPRYRRRGHASALVRRVEDFARAASVPVIWLYTDTAEALYARLGWERVGTEQEHGSPVALMRRSLRLECGRTRL